jgi:hypothetical protein
MCKKIFAESSIKEHLETHQTPDGRQHVKRKELALQIFLDNNQISYDPQVTIDFRCINPNLPMKRAFPDFTIMSFGGIIFFLEVDESQHASYGVSCELKRMAFVHESLAKEGIVWPVKFIRFNPDNFSVDGQKQIVDVEERYSVLSKFMREHPPLPENSLSIVYMYYDIEDGELEMFSDPAFTDLIKPAVSWVY